MPENEIRETRNPADAADADVRCCAPAVEETCCEPEAKTSCCGPEPATTCGC